MNQPNRIPPLPVSDRSPRQRVLLESVLGDEAPNLFATVVRNEDLYETWLPFCMKLLRSSAFPRRERELVILRAASRCAAAYELAHHEGIATRAGLTAAEIADLVNGDGASLGEAERALVEAVDQLVDSHRIGDDLWSRLAARFDERQLIELPMLVGHYALLAMLLNGLQVPLDEESAA